MTRASPAPGDRGPLVSIVIVSKLERSLGSTLDALAPHVDAFCRSTGVGVEVLVVDASSGRLADIQRAHGEVRWIDFAPPAGTRVSIAHQRNVGVRAGRGDVVVFLDAGCLPEEGWLRRLVDPILAGEEEMACGATGATGALDPHRWGRSRQAGMAYLAECPTVNLALSRRVVEAVGAFDERFEYGSDIDFSWRAVHQGIRIRHVPQAVVRHDWGTPMRQLRRAYGSGKGRARLYAKHVLGSSDQSVHKRTLAEHDVVPLAYSLFLLGLPFGIRHRAYRLLLLVPLWRSRHGGPVAALADHLVQGVGVLAGAAELGADRLGLTGVAHLPALGHRCAGTGLACAVLDEMAWGREGRVAGSGQAVHLS